MSYAPTGRQPKFRYHIGNFVLFTNYGRDEYGQIKFLFYEGENAIYRVQKILPTRDDNSGEICWFKMEEVPTAVYEYDIYKVLEL